MELRLLWLQDREFSFMTHLMGHWFNPSRVTKTQCIVSTMPRMANGLPVVELTSVSSFGPTNWRGFWSTVTMMQSRHFLTILLPISLLLVLSPTLVYGAQSRNLFKNTRYSSPLIQSENFTTNKVKWQKGAKT